MLSLLGVTSLESRRDPFFYPDGLHRYSCIGIGFINDRPVLATIAIDGTIYSLKQGQKILGNEVISLHKAGITLRDSQGVHHILVMNNA